MKSLLFHHGPVSRMELAAAALRYHGIAYRADHTWIGCDPGGNTGGWVNCYGVLLLAARDVGLLPPEFDVNLSPARFGQREEKSLVELLQINFKCHEWTDGWQQRVLLGDVVVFRYRDVNPELNEPHHVGIVVEEANPAAFRPARFLHASQYNGRVMIDELAGLYEDRLYRAYSLLNFFLG